MQDKGIKGFSKLSKVEKIEWLNKNFLNNENGDVFSKFWNTNEDLQRVVDGFSENTISNYYLPYGLAPNFLIDGKMYCVPMVIEESSVVAAAASAAKYWMDRGGFTTTILGTTKVGHVHFLWEGSFAQLENLFPELEQLLRKNVAQLTQNMELRGGGIERIELLDFNHTHKNLFQLRAHFQTCDSMGANFINTILEQFALIIEQFFINHAELSDQQRDVELVMSILSNYTPECVVRAEVQCPIKDLGSFPNGMMAQTLAEKFCLAVKIAKHDVYRATTHNKGIYNGIDAVVLATGNDFRAIEAAGHAYAARNGQYSGLSSCEIENGNFRFWLEVPLSVGTVGGLTSLHPLAKKSLEILGNPDASTMMGIIASVGLAQNFGAVKSLVTTGIQKGHMKMHLMNILNHLEATAEEIQATSKYFENKTITYSDVRHFLDSLREK